jgi:hypothetical protein
MHHAQLLCSFTRGMLCGKTAVIIGAFDTSCAQAAAVEYASPVVYALLVQDLPKELVDSHYPSTDQLPDYFTNTAYIRFTPEVDCLALPGEANLDLAAAELAVEALRHFCQHVHQLKHGMQLRL